MYFNDVHIAYYIVVAILGLFMGEVVGWLDERLPEYKKVFSKEFFSRYKLNFKPHYILMILNSAIYVTLLYRYGIQETLIANFDLIKFMILTPMLLAAFVIDYRLQIIPNRLNLTILEVGIVFAFLYGYPDVTTILLDEPDAHLHNNLQKKIVNYLIDKNKQFLIATHSEEFIRNVDIHSIISIMSGRPIAIDSTEKIINALSEVDNNDILRTQDSAYILYVEGEDDDRILAAWANIIGETDVYQKFYTYSLGGRSKKLMKERSDCHYTALKQIVPTLKRMVLLDYDTEDSYHPDPTNPCLKEWKRKNIDNYLLVPNAWKRAVAFQLNESEDSLFLSPYYSIINDFFESQNLYLPRNATWRTVNANIFSIIDGKKLLFSNPDSLFNRILVASDGQLKISRQNVALAMRPEEVHQDIYDFFQTLKQVSAEAQENLSQESNC